MEREVVFEVSGRGFVRGASSEDDAATAARNEQHVLEWFARHYPAYRVTATEA
eukprot:COSAG06_NODE_38304_length_425_cov_0.610429_1_plen_52_part_01